MGKRADNRQPVDEAIGRLDLHRALQELQPQDRRFNVARITINQFHVLQVLRVDFLHAANTLAFCSSPFAFT